MDHAAAHERIIDLALDPSGLAGLASSTAADDAALREHVAACDECAAELSAWQQVQARLRESLAGRPPTEVARIAAPADLRPRVLRATRSGSVSLSRRQWQRPRLRALVGLAAALAVVVVVGAGIGALRDQTARLDEADAAARWLASALAASNRVLAAPERRVVPLSAPDGAATGTLAWSRHDLVVLASGLAPPPATYVYRCWVAADGRETAVGTMHYVNGEAFWVGSLDEWASIDLSPGRNFMVSLEEEGADAQHRSGPVVLEGSTGG